MNIALIKSGSVFDGSALACKVDSMIYLFSFIRGNIFCYEPPERI